MLKKVWSFIVGIFQKSVDFKPMLGNERYELIKTLVLEADKLVGMNGEQKRQWVRNELKGLIERQGNTLINWANEWIKKPRDGAFVYGLFILRNTSLLLYLK